ncbi:MAG: hypothetical protein Q9175_001734 [Cornicularia normoerica]
MDRTMGSEHLPNPMLVEAEVPSEPGLDPRMSVESQTSKLNMCHSGLGFQKTTFLDLVDKSARDARIMSIAHAAPLAQSSYRLEESFDLPLRLALGKLSVKRRIFACMDQGDTKTDIESSTGLSHQCIKLHRRMWRIEGSHPRPQSRKILKSSTPGPRSPNTRNERRSRKRRKCDDQSDSSDFGSPSGSKRSREHRAVDQPKGCSMRAGAEMSRVGAGKCAEGEKRGSSFLIGKENIPEMDEAMWTSGEMTVLPIRGLGSERDCMN